MESNYSAADALRDVEAARASTATHMATPWWYHPILAVILGVTTLMIGLDLALPIALGILAVVAIAIGVLIAAYRHVSGGWISFRQAGPRSRPLWYAYASSMAVLIILAVIANHVLHLPWVAWMAAAFVFLATISAGPVIDRKVLEDIAAGEAGSQK
ncbi:MAG TPA: hypothetical protein GX743_00835 [Actinomycetales bacterium]|nr:hypothetical protein [Actinomycetales bacterium]